MKNLMRKGDALGRLNRARTPYRRKIRLTCVAHNMFVIVNVALFENLNSNRILIIRIVIESERYGLKRNNLSSLQPMLYPSVGFPYLGFPYRCPRSGSCVTPARATVLPAELPSKLPLTRTHANMIQTRIVCPVG